MRLNKEERDILRNSVKNFLVQNPSAKKLVIVNHFIEQGYKRRTIYNTINRVVQGLSSQDLPRSGRPRILTKRQLSKIKIVASNKVGVSQRKLSRKYHISQRSVGRHLKAMGIRYYRRQKVPKYTKKR